MLKHIPQTERDEANDLHIILNNLGGNRGECELGNLRVRLMDLLKKEELLELEHQQNMLMWNTITKIYPELLDVPLWDCPRVFAEMFK